MEFQINKLIESDIPMLKDLGWLLFRRDGEGLTQEEVSKLLTIVNDDVVEGIIEEVRSEYDEHIYVEI